ncbi:MAG: methionine gamma-lyase family protein [Candidatus Gastranaerophilales bacterium]|nr:methionine gamma-lyase family protein [Candidatus Gastranaerophilales bacterium]
MKPETIVDEAENSLRNRFLEIDKITEYNQKKVLDAFYKNKIGEEHFYTVTGYGHDDMGRDALDKVFAEVFKAEAAIVRPHFVSGTHTLACALFGVLHYNDRLVSIAGEPYDTMQEVIGSRVCEDFDTTLIGHGVKYTEVPLNGEDVDYENIEKYLLPDTKMVLIQRSRGYSLRKPLSIADIERIIKIVKNKNPQICCFVDNCYGEFVEAKEPIEVGADLIAGSLIKNPGGGIVEAGGYIAGKKKYVDMASRRLTAPGIGSEGGAMHNQTRVMLQGFFIAPNVVSDAHKGAILASKVFENMGFSTFPKSNDIRTDLIQTIKLNNSQQQQAFCAMIQKCSPVESYLTPIPDTVPGYDCDLLMAGGSFIEGSTIELSADGPVREPWAIYLQGGLNYFHVKIALKGIVEKLATLLDNDKKVG